ncbi:MAG: MerR family transcriptional regulator [Nitrospirota bacterium]|nr:MerR family transcriptional regulator [Nitrospirota bacterium]MDH5699609.1 MerR family transcriptional regulator [Nitrospirota bacterium]
MSNIPNDSQKYRIKSVASTTGLSTHVIRKWEERYNLVHPQRGPNGYRLFTEDDIQFLLYLKSQLDHGESIGQLAQAGEHELRQSMHHVPLNLSGIAPLYWNDTQEMIRLARHQDLRAITTMIEKWINHMGLEKALDSIIFPLLRLIGELWHQGGMSLREEQSVSRLVRQHLINVLREEPPLGGPHALIACVPGDFHEIAPLTAAVLLRGLGWHSIYLGPNVSFEMLEMALRRKQTQLILLACNLEPGEKILRSWLQKITRHLQPSCAVMVGGPGFKPYAPLLRTHNIVYFTQVQDIKTLQQRTGMGESARAFHPSSFISWQS